MNPFKVLGLKKASVSNREIIQAAALGLREKKYSATEVARAQKLLLDPVSRSCQEFLWFIDLSDLKKEVMEKIIDLSTSLGVDRQAGNREHEPDFSDLAELRLLNVFEQDQDF